jgi:Xaa-Pro aminopeptidase
VSGREASGREQQRIDALSAELTQRGVDALVVDGAVNVRYLTGFTGSSGLALIAAGDRQGAGARFFTDFRYTTQSAEQIPPSLDREIVTGNLLDAAARSLDGSGGTLGFDDASLTVAEHERLRETLVPAWELRRCAGAVERLRAVKDAAEIERMRAASKLA